MGCRCMGQDEIVLSSSTIAKDYQEFRDLSSGEGCKRTVAWKATLLRNELERKREEFWRTRSTGYRHVWLTLKQAIEADHETAALLLSMAEINMKEGNIQRCVDYDGNEYRIPVFVVNDPIAYGPEPCASSMEKREIVQETIKLKFRRLGIETDLVLEVNSMELVKEVKQKYSEEDGVTVGSLRMFFGGKELEEDRTVASYYIRDRMVVQMYIKTN